MPSITWLHLSDLHACTARTGWDAGRVQKALLEDLKVLREEHGLEPQLLFFTGDAAWGQVGKQTGETIAEQFQEFGRFLDAIRGSLGSKCPWKNVFLVPGNHDVNRDLVDEAHTEWQDNDRRSIDDVTRVVRTAGITWQGFLRRLEDYQRFLETHGNLGHLLEFPNHLIYTAGAEPSEVKVGIAGFNTAWSCCRGKERNQLWMASHWQHEKLFARLQDCRIRIALAHHPIEWLHEKETNRARTALERDFEFYLHGHEHESWVRPLDNQRGHTRIAVGACYQGSHMKNAYNVVRLDLDRGVGEIWLRKYVEAGAKWVPDVDGEADERGVWTIRPKWMSRLQADVARQLRSGSPAATPAAAGVGHESFDSYLRALEKEHGTIKVVGFSRPVAIPIRLEEVYVPLCVEVRQDFFADEAHEYSSRAEFSAARPERSSIDLKVALASARRLARPGMVLLGDPGGGKTTLLKHLALGAVKSRQRGENVYDLPAGAIPILIPLRSLSAPSEGLKAAVVDALAGLALKEEGATLAEALLARGNLLVLLDGLDEVADEGERAAISTWIEDAQRQFSGSIFILSSRYVAYRGNARLDGRFLEVHVHGLEEADTRLFVERWYAEVESQLTAGAPPGSVAKRASARAADLCSRLFEPNRKTSERLRDLVSNPMMLQILCLLHRDNKPLPSSRVELYHEGLIVLLELWRKAKGLPTDFTAEDCFRLLEPFAWWLQSSGRKAATEDEIREHLKLPEDQRGLDERGVSTLLAKIRDQSGVLVFQDQRRYAFLHLSFQEYLAARHVQTHLLREPRFVRELASHFRDDEWKDVFLVAVGLEKPSLFCPLLAELLRQEKLHENPILTAALMEEAHARSAVPILDALESATIQSADERNAALGLLKSVPDWEKESSSRGLAAREVVRRIAEQDPSSVVRSSAAERLGLQLAVRPARGRDAAPEPGEERIHPADGSVLVYVPGGEYTLGSESISDREKPVHVVRLSPFWIGKYPVTNELYARFLAKNPKAPKPDYWNNKRFNPPQHPVVGVSWHDVQAYCRWAGLVLPSEAQWEAAARGTDQRVYPWGNDPPTSSHANFDGHEGGTTPVGAYPSGAGPFGTLDQAGNVWEWCADGWDPKAYRGRKGKPDPLTPPGGGDRAVVALRGGAWYDVASNLAAAYRSRIRAGHRNLFLGFRCVLVSSSEHD